MLPDRTIRGASVPAFFYGTAWKEDATEKLVRLALDAGFRAIDTANQRKHMAQDLAIDSFELDADEVAQLERVR